MDAAVAAVQQAAAENEQTIQDIVNSLAVVQETGQSTSAVMSQKAVTDEILTSINITGGSYSGYYINASTNKWAKDTTTAKGAICYFFPVKANTDIFITSNNDMGYAIAFVSDTTHEYNTTPHYITGYNSVIIGTAGQTDKYNVPVDCYLYVLDRANNTAKYSRFPASIKRTSSKIQDVKDDITNQQIWKNKTYKILHQQARYPTSGFIYIQNAPLRECVNKIFTMDELLRIHSITMPTGFEVALNLTKTTSTNNDYINYGWMTKVDDVVTIPPLETNYNYGVFTFKRDDNGTFTQADTDTLNRGVIFHEVADYAPTKDDVANDYCDYSSKPIFVKYGYRQEHTYLRQPLYVIADLHSNGLANSIQSICWKDATHVMIFNPNATYALYDILTDEFIPFGKPATGHCNDVTQIGSMMYVNGSAALNGDAEMKLMYAWNLTTNTATQIDTSSIVNGSVGKRVIGGVATKDDNNIIVVCYDFNSSGNVEGEKMAIYNYAISSGTFTLSYELPWVGRFVQGAAYLPNGLLYVACNLPPNGSTYAGIAIWCIDMTSGTLLDKLIIEGVFEPQGLQATTCGFETYLDFGMTHYGNITNVIRTRAF
jgi:hypothetical protein